MVFNRALKKLVRTPAPDLPALSAKLDLAVDHEIWELTGGEACLAALKRDARRFAGRDDRRLDRKPVGAEALSF